MKKILIVDDDPDFLDMLESKLYFHNYQVVRATGGEEAIRLAKSEKPDLIIMDVLMPEPDGIKVSVRLKMDDDTKLIPIFFLTALQNHDKEMKQFEEHAKSNMIFAKPLDSSLIFKKIQEIFGESL